MEVAQRSERTREREREGGRMTTVLALGRGHRFATGTRRATPARARLVAGSRRSRSPSATVRCRAGQGAGRPGEEKKKKKWSLRRFAGQLLFFRGGGLKRVATFPVRLVGKAVGLVRGKPKTTAEGDVVEVLFEAEAEGGLGEEAAADAPVVMVAGATGGVGKRCVATLLSRGARVRCLVRDAAKARAMLTASDCLDGAAPGSRLELCAADITQPKTLLPEHFEGVERVVCATACKVAPKEGDTENRDKYYQGKKGLAKKPPQGGDRVFHDALTSAHHRFCPPFPCPAPPNQKASSSSTQRSLATPPRRWTSVG